MNALSAKTRDRLLYMISPLLFLALWQLLLMAGIGDRRFIPAPSDIAVRFWQLVLSGELAMHTGVTLLRVFGEMRPHPFGLRLAVRFIGPIGLLGL